MAKNKKYNVKYARRRKNLTNYKKRLKLVSSGKVRLVLRKSLNNFLVQFVEYHDNGDKVLALGSSTELSGVGWKANKGNTSAAYLTGLIAGLKAKKNGVKEAIVDIGLHQTSSKMYAALKGVVDAGIKVPHSNEILPKENRIKGEHIASYAKGLDKQAYNKQFSNYVKSGLKPEDLISHFDETKKKIMEKYHG